MFKKFIGLLDQETINSTLAGYWAAVLSSLNSKYNDKCIEFFCNNPEYFQDKLIKHFYLAAISDTTLKILSEDNSQINNDYRETFKKMKETLLFNIVNLFDCSSIDCILNAYQLLFSIIECRGALFDVIASEKIIRLIYSIASKKVSTCSSSEISRTSLKYCLGILKLVLENASKPQTIIMMDSPKKLDESLNITPIISDEAKVKEILEVAKIPIEKEAENQGFKQLRISIVEFVNALLLTANEAVIQFLIGTKIYYELAKYFLLFPECSLLSCAVIEGITFFCKNAANYPDFIVGLLHEESIIKLLADISDKNQINKTIYAFQYELLKLILDANAKLENRIKDIPTSAVEEHNHHKAVIGYEIGIGIYKKSLAKVEPIAEKHESPMKDDLTSETQPPNNEKQEDRLKDNIIQAVKEIAQEKEHEVLQAQSISSIEANLHVEYYFKPTSPNLSFNENKFDPGMISQTYLGNSN